ncbi:hypothetical protein DSO57_1036758 [Entomophthora muscae]|uniref:Uncharacterized protein n=1 Tax=Entomophthora muscae TaxID=34485 RepID=A0ACC2RQ27_9FUNG|nr:hypothetical protein DSO57_1036758 [Entomophthora muscae]
MKLSFALIFQTAAAHMAMTLPAPRRSPQHPAYRGSGADYDITAPLGGRAKFPCRGAPAGPIFKSYQAGSDIDVRIGGSAVHGGGHCQFSMTYDSVNFAVLKTVMGNCLTASREYKVGIPKDAPNGNVTFAWTWFNKKGNREIYMNCADITITGGSNSGTITGKKMVVANWPGYPTFPEGFANNYGKALYENQPLITISPPTPKPLSNTQHLNVSPYANSTRKASTKF